MKNLNNLNLNLDFFQNIMCVQNEEKENQFYDDIWNWQIKNKMDIDISDSFVQCENGDKIAIRDLPNLVEWRKIKKVFLYTYKENIITE